MCVLPILRELTLRGDIDTHPMVILKTRHSAGILSLSYVTPHITHGHQTSARYITALRNTDMWTGLSMRTQTA